MEEELTQAAPAVAAEAVSVAVVELHEWAEEPRVPLEGPTEEL
jgi:hypothetical protein